VDIKRFYVEFRMKMFIVVSYKRDLPVAIDFFVVLRSEEVRT
jgi:hypothetical protein